MLVQSISTGHGHNDRSWLKSVNMYIRVSSLSNVYGLPVSDLSKKDISRKSETSMFLSETSKVFRVFCA